MIHLIVHHRCLDNYGAVLTFKREGFMLAKFLNFSLGLVL
ncbi:hypothetical protein ENTCAN_06694 [Enterobacter cancerogenus ATCC 35316]|nr:hypothetical protein ENTCAN_06694 [Enterobacter cancerogenus ATCC 35316]